MDLKENSQKFHHCIDKVFMIYSNLVDNAILNISQYGKGILSTHLVSKNNFVSLHSDLTKKMKLITYY